MGEVDHVTVCIILLLAYLFGCVRTSSDISQRIYIYAMCFTITYYISDILVGVGETEMKKGMFSLY